MQVSKEHIILLISALTLVFLVAGGFLLLYVGLYNQRKKKHMEEKQRMQDLFQKELIKTQMEVQEQTLQTIASDIHDNVGQLLSLAKLTLSSVNVENPEKTGQKVDQALSIVDTSMKELRQLANVLHAHNLLAQGLEQAVQNEINRIAKTDRFQIRWQTIGSKAGSIGTDRALIAFRLMQEVLNNIIKHADASEIHLTFEYGNGGLIITIKDNGKGFEVPQAIQRKEGMGINNFYKRASLIQAQFQLQSEPQKGTTAILHIPYS